MQKKKEFFFINGLRFFAAFWVLLFHASIHFGELDLLGYIQPLLDQGTLAMTLFFMLSGFILSYRYSTFSNAEDIRQYAAARVARLYPVYIFMGLSTIWLITQDADQFWIIDRLGDLGYVPFIIVVILLFLLGVQAWFPSLLGVWNFGGSWSLSVETFFYVLFPWLRKIIGKLSNRILIIANIVCVVIIASIAVGMLISLSLENSKTAVYYILPIFRLPEFILGICGYVLFVERGLQRRNLSFIGIASTALLVLCIYWHNFPGFIEWGLFAAPAFMSIFVFCLDINASSIIKKVLNYLGHISYCVYMAQFTTIPVVKKFAASCSSESQWGLLLFSTILLAAFTYHFIEVVSYAKTKNLAAKCFRFFFGVLKMPLPKEK